MNYFKEEEKTNLINKLKKSKVIFLIVLSVFIIASILVLFLKNTIGNLVSLILLIIFSAVFFSYLLVYIQVYNFNKRLVNLYEKDSNNSSLITGTIKSILSINTINQLQYKKIIISTNDGDRQLFLYDALDITYEIGEKKVLKVCGNIIIGEDNYEETIN